MAVAATDVDARIEEMQRQLLERASAHEAETQKLQSMVEVLSVASRSSEDKLKVMDGQTELIKYLRADLNRVHEMVDKLTAEKDGSDKGERGRDSKDSKDGKDDKDWKKKFDLDCRPKHDLRDNGAGFGEWRDKMERYLASGDRRIKEVLKLAAKAKKTVTEDGLEQIASMIEWDLDELKVWDTKIQGAIMGAVTGENHLRIQNASTGADAWRVLTARWEPKNVSRAYDLRKRCNSLVPSQELHGAWGEGGDT